MLVAVIDHAPNCPVHDGKYYHGLEWFISEEFLIDWVCNNTKHNYFIKEIWDENRKVKSDWEVKYEMSQHCVVEAHVKKGGRLVALVRRHPYSDEKSWVVEAREADN